MKSVINDMTYDEIRDQLKTGDLVLFSGKGLISWAIKKITKNDCSHIGMVLKMDDYDFVAVWESTTLNEVPTIYGTQEKGVQIVQLSKRIETYKGTISIRQLEGFTMGQRELDILAKLREELKHRKYERNVLSLIKAAWDGKWGKNKKRDLSSLFCSELVAEAYLRIGLIPKNQTSSEYTPADFSEKGGLQLLKGWLGPEIAINH